LPEGWFVVEAPADAEWAEKVDLAALSSGCEIVTHTLDNGGGNRATGWRDGRRNWLIDAYEELEIAGELPPEAEPVMAALAEFDDPDERNFDPVTWLADAVVGYVYGSSLSENAFEILDYPEFRDLPSLAFTRLTVALTAAGFERAAVQEAVESDYVSARFVKLGLTLAGMTPEVDVSVARHHYGGAEIDGSVWVMAQSVNDVLCELPAQAWLDGASEKWLRGDQVTVLGLDRRPGNVVLDVAGIEHAVTEFVSFVEREVGAWFTTGDEALDRLIALVQSPPLVNTWALRPTVVACLLAGRTDRAAELMQWYLDIGAYPARDCAQRITLFDNALQDRFPEFARARMTSDA